jgi:hypothetical protein
MGLASLILFFYSFVFILLFNIKLNKIEFYNLFYFFYIRLLWSLKRKIDKQVLISVESMTRFSSLSVNLSYLIHEFGGLTN